MAIKAVILLCQPIYKMQLLILTLLIIKKADVDQVYVTGNKDVKSGDTSIQVQHNPATETNTSC